MGNVKLESYMTRQLAATYDMVVGRPMDLENCVK